MTPSLRYRLAINAVALGLVTCGPATAEDVGGTNYATWKQAPHNFKSGFAYAVELSLTMMCDSEASDPDCTKSWPRLEHFRKCLRGVNSSTIVDLVDEYVTRHPEEMSKPWMFFVHDAISELCGPIPQ